jgi:hypothetical protein
VIQSNSNITQFKTVYQSVDWDTFNNQLKSDGWNYVSREEIKYEGTQYIRVCKQVPSTISSLVEPYKQYIEYLTRNSLRFILSPISDFDCLCGPFYNYYCLVDIRLTPSSLPESKDYPFEVWCHGNDDAAWYGYYKTKKECDEILDYLEQETDMPSLYDFLKAYGLTSW